VHAATRLLLAYTLACLHVTSAADWELVNLERAVKGSRVLELTGDSLEQAVQDHPLLVVWFYAPWCKQCKLLRDAYEEAASTGVPGVTFGRLDCVKYPKVKQDYGIFSYPALKVVRGDRHRWLYTAKQRTSQMIVAAASAEVDGAYRLLESADMLRSALHEQAAEKGCEPADGNPALRDPMLCAGAGESAVVALLSSADGSPAAAYSALAAGTDIRLSPTPFLATTRPELLALLATQGLEELAADQLAVLAFNESGAGDWVVSATAPLHTPLPELEALVVGHRVPLLVDFTADPYWAKRAASLPPMMHGLFFAAASDAHLRQELREAGAAFTRGALVFFLFDADAPMAEGMMSKYGVGGKADCPKLVFLDTRLELTNRQVPYDRPIVAVDVREFLLRRQMPLIGAVPDDDDKDEL